MSSEHVDIYLWFTGEKSEIRVLNIDLIWQILGAEGNCPRKQEERAQGCSHKELQHLKTGGRVRNHQRKMRSSPKGDKKIREF